MSCESDTEEKCFTVIWKLINASYSLREDSKIIESPVFTVDELLKAKFTLVLDFSLSKIRFFLKRKDNISLEDTYATVEFAFLSGEGKVLKSNDENYSLDTEQEKSIGMHSFADVNEVFFEKRALYLPHNILTTRCRIWHIDEEFSKNVQYLAHTRIGVEKRLFLWKIESFSSLLSNQKYEVKSLDKIKSLMSLELCSTGGSYYDNEVFVKIISYHQSIKNFTLQIFILDALNNTVKCFEDDIFARCSGSSKKCTLTYTKNKLIDRRDLYLPNNTLTLLFKCAFSFGIKEKKIEISNCESILIKKQEQKDLAIHKNILAEDFKSMLNSSCLSDVKLQTKSQEYPAHKCILSARSPVFKAMFENDMRENINNVVNVDDLNDNTVTRLLNYIYNAEVGELEWDIATELYEAADKYLILSLKNICTSYLKANLCLNNSCMLLSLADLHQDKDLKIYVQNFILQHGTDIINSKEWDKLMENNLKLAAETMRLKFKSK